MSLENFPNSFLNFSERNVNGEERHFYQFKSFRLDVEERQLTHRSSPVPLTPKAFDVLTVLVERGGHLVEKEELLRIVWADSFVEEINVARIVHTLRKVLGENENDNKYIETVAKKGYRFVAEVTEVREPIAQKSANGKPDFSTAIEKSSETIVEEKLPETTAAEKISATDLQIAPSATDEIIAPSAAKPKYKTRIILFTVGFATAVFLILLVSFNWQSKSSVNPNEPKSIAVLPLKSLTAENREPIYELGIADSLILNLSQAKNLTVRPLSATQQYGDVKKDAVAAGLEQKVDYVLASNYQIADGKIRITSQLINVSNGAVEEVFKEEQNISTAFAVQDAFAANIGQKLLTKLNRKSNSGAAKRYTVNEEAYRLYLQGAALTDRRNRKDAEKAVEYLEQAVRLDPNYALAYATLANAHGAIANFGGDNHEQYLKQKSAIEKALAIDENMAEAHSQLGVMKMNYEWDFDGAERALKKAVELDANSSIAHRTYAVYLGSMGRFDEAVAEIKTAIDIEPASVINQRILGNTLFFARRYDEAIVQLLRTVEMDPTFRTTYGWLINSYRMKGEDDEAFEWWVKFLNVTKESPERISLLKEIYAKSGWRGIYGQQIAEAKEDERNGKDPPWNLAQNYINIGDKEQAIITMQKDFDKNQRGWAWTILKVDPRNDLLRDDPRFEDLVKRVGLK